jgi:hypothetical protein
MTSDQKRSVEVTARLRDIGRGLHARVKDFFENAPGLDATPLELLQATLDELERKVQPAGRGRRVFPYDRIVVRIAQPGADAAAIEAIFRQLEPRLRDRLMELQCEGPETIVTNIAIVDPSGDTVEPLLAIECLNDRSATPVTPPQQPGAHRSYPTITITVLKGQCSAPEYVFEEPVIAIGRTAEPTDAFGQIRVNHVAFLQVRDGVNETVGRAHARLQFESASGHFHLFNEGSSNPTSVIRNGRMTRVPPRDPRGVRVQSGDQLQLGRAVLRLTIE